MTEAESGVEEANPGTVEAEVWIAHHPCASVGHVIAGVTVLGRLLVAVCRLDVEYVLALGQLPDGAPRHLRRDAVDQPEGLPQLEVAEPAYGADKGFVPGGALPHDRSDHVRGERQRALVCRRRT